MIFVFIILSSSSPKSRLCVGISVETVEVAFFVTELETLQILGVEMSTGGPSQMQGHLKHFS
jgi:hypothetical protein